MEKEARVVIRAEGEDDVARAAQKVSSAWASAGNAITGGFKGAAGAVTEAVSGIVSDLSHVVTVAGAISFEQSLHQVHAFEESVSRMGIGSGQAIKSVQEGINSLATDINQMPEATGAWVDSVKQLTYSYDGAKEAAKGMSEYAALTGQALPQVQGLAVALAQVGGIAGDTTRVIGTFAAQAAALKVQPKEIGDAYQHLSTQISGLAGGGGPAIGALLGGFGGKGMTTIQRERSLGGILGKLEGNTVGLESLLGHKATDEYGHLTDATGTMEEIQKKAKGSKYWENRFKASFGVEAMAGLMHTDFSAIRAAGGMRPSDDAKHALDALKGTAAGERKADEIAKNIGMQGVVGSGSLLGDASDWVGRMAAGHPVLTGLGIQLAPRLIGKGLGALGGLFGGGGGAAAGGAGLLGLLGGGAALLGAGAAGYGFGTALDRGFGISDAITGTGASSRIKSGEDAADVGRNQALASHVRDIRASNARKHMLAGQPQMAEAAASGGDTRAAQLVDRLVQAGESLQAAQEAAKAQLATGAKGIHIEVINMSGGSVDAILRGDQ